MKKTITYYSRQVIYLEKLMSREDNKMIIFVYNILKRYYTHKWEMYYDKRKSL